jgi:hypothetical protein
VGREGNKKTSPEERSKAVAFLIFQKPMLLPELAPFLKYGMVAEASTGRSLRLSG